MLHKETVDVKTLDLIKKLFDDNELRYFSLAGGTALAMQLGHRKSTDAGLFTRLELDAPAMARHLESAYGAEITAIAPNGVLGKIGDIKIGLLSNKRPIVANPITIEGIRMASLDDIGAMKMHTILNTGQQVRDFVDMYYLLEHRSLDALTRAFYLKYPDDNVSLARKSLLYYGGLRGKDVPETLLRPFNWKKITERMAIAVEKPGDVFRKTIKREKKMNNIEGLAVKKAKKRGKTL